MNKVVGVITARMTSTRLPGKVLKNIAGKSVFAHHVERMKKVPGISDVYLATSKDERNEPLIEESKKLGVKYYAGSEAGNVFAAAALIVDSPLSRLLGNFFLGINKPKMPVRLCKNEDEALEWIASLNDKRRTI